MSNLPEPINITFDAIGTTWTIEIFDSMTVSNLEQLRLKITKRIELFDRHYSRFRTDSIIAMMSQKAGAYTLPDDARPMLDLYQSLYRHTAGAVTPLIGKTLSDAGYDAEYSLKPGAVRATERWEDVLDYDYPSLTLTRPALLDFGAAGKGYLVDIISTLIRDAGCGGFCVNAGGDIVYQTAGGQKLDIALEHPADPTLAIGIAHIHNQSLCGSAGNRRAWAGYHHIIDPRSLTSPRHIQAVWVVADTGLLADGLSTALFFSDAQLLQKHYTFEYAIVRDDFSLDRSTDFPATFFN